MNLAIHCRRSRVALRSISLCIASLGIFGIGRLARAADAPPAASQWLVYNATLKGIAGNALADNGFNANCKGWSWQQAGFLDANGGLLPINATTGNIVNGSTIVGVKVGPGRWVNPTTGIGVADLSGGATLQDVYTGMLPFANNQDGLLHISSHGPIRKKDDNPIPGGMIMLDNNKCYSGFKDASNPLPGGTGVPKGTPYAITTAAAGVGSTGGGRFNLELYNCNSGLDPDGGGVQISVAASALSSFGNVTINGNSQSRLLSVKSSMPVVACNVNVDASNFGSLTLAQFTNAVVNYMQTFPGSFNNCTTPSAFLSGFSADKHLSVLNTKMAKIPLTKNGKVFVQPTWNLSYVQSTTLTPDGQDAAMDNPVIFTPGDGAATAEYNSPEGGLSASSTISDITGGSSDGTTMHLCSASDVDLDSIGSPDGLTLATSMVRLSPYADSFSSIIGQATLQYADGVDPDTIALYELEGSTWVPFSTPGTTVIDSSELTASASYAFTGEFDEADGIVLAGFGVEVPEPASALAAAVAFAAVLRRRARR